MGLQDGTFIRTGKNQATMQSNSIFARKRRNRTLTEGARLVRAQRAWRNVINRTQSRTLATLRAALLPKLLSGELTVANS